MSTRWPFESRRHYAIRCGLPLLSLDDFIRCYEKNKNRFVLKIDFPYVVGPNSLNELVFTTWKDQRRYKRWRKAQKRLENEREFKMNMEWLNAVCGGVLFDDEGGSEA